MTNLSHRSAAVFAAVFGMAILAAPVAHAFTFEGASGVPGGTGGASLADPDERISRFGNGTSSSTTTTTIQNGNTSLRFGSPVGGQQMDDRAVMDRMFAPSNLMGR